ncbi:Na+/H+ antiporter NhaA [Clostridium saccharobutylicum]|uniref:Na(+)/H(+) antiporter NhaA n=1 Tax=Clostridium saccharobutylicum DSM 13864 TaxID=1345695 RepID=U5MXS5_CLOSA|nr:Na+/H+ antiporter NhaA [Clostridium saccharobutylicum]AGX44282.1 Na(+)/H(+) antiporter NhaA 2 [Clostridium saccharobutylicum DSM 13864]AQR91571.1 Na(+)/H(+) antiporter NhaA [Clostridium saccharobutylicum]AQS01476.1 Na(+)/H(+) antiporter NhaA [Clostridium saccharobutylicum]AQS15459.1 Na(+)/H(+) antiporter NhaA [Clostridium saccharobutylicum]MBA2907426.1 NhaA family Na+:H+ antiporter [Clostridium saccharobutylicum]
MKYRIYNKILNPFIYFLKNESSSGIVLLICSIIAIVIANSSFAESYEGILHTYATIGYKQFSLSMSVLHWINDGLMAIFFLVVGMEIKREMVIGELKSFKRTILPISAAVGGMIVPAIIYSLFNYGKVTITGWGIPMATDIAFALGILSLVGKKAPKGIVVFLTALAIVDDLGAIIVIAIFYTNQIIWSAFFSGLFILFILILANRFNVRYKSVYIILGIILWICLLKSGIHSTIAGVLLGMTLPIGKNANEFNKSILSRFEHVLSPWSSFVIMPIFALANAGIEIDINSFSTTIFSPVSLGIIFGLFIGKQIGIFGVSYILVKFKIAKLPAKVTKKHLYGASVLGGIGFTMSIFVSSLSFSDIDTLSLAKTSIMIASILAAIVGSIIFKILEFRKTSR